MFKSFVTKKIVVGIIAGLMILGAGTAILASKNGKGEVAVVERKDIVAMVSVTGKTKARNEVELGFDTSGRIARSIAPVGSKVSRGALIAVLDQGEAQANILKERAILREQEVSLQDDEKNLVGAIRQAYEAADNAIHNKIDQFFKTPRTNPVFEVKFTDGNYIHYFNVDAETVIDLNNRRRNIETILNKWQSEFVSINNVTAPSFADPSLDKLNTLSDFLNKIAYAVNSFTPAEFAYNDTVEGYKTDVDSARNGLTSARSALILAKENSGIAGEAKISQIKSSIVALESQLSKSQIVAPFDGTITRNDAKPGGVAKSGEPLISMISENDMYVEANVSEINIGKIEVNNPVKIEFDAFPGEIFEGRVAFIDPGETIVDKVVNYKIRVELAPNSRVKSGLTANIKIMAKNVSNVLSLPIYALEKKDGKYFANVIANSGSKNGHERREVEVGLEGSDGFVEVRSGLAEGDKVLIP